MKRLSERQSDLLKKSEEKEKLTHLTLLKQEKELSTSSLINQKHKDTILTLTHSQTLLKIQLESSQTTLAHTQSLIQEKTESLEDALHKSFRLEEHQKTLESQISTLQSMSRAGMDERLQKELEDYKLLLKCSSCNIRFKTHCLGRCMHCFWYGFFLMVIYF